MGKYDDLEKIKALLDQGILTPDEYKTQKQQIMNSAYSAQPPSTAANDAPSADLSVLGFFFPFIGLIFFLVWQRDCPQKARSIGKGALINVLVSLSLCLLFFLLVTIFRIVGATATSSAPAVPLYPAAPVEVPSIETPSEVLPIELPAIEITPVELSPMDAMPLM